jgi:hypothetical protein
MMFLQILAVFRWQSRATLPNCVASLSTQFANFIQYNYWLACKSLMMQVDEELQDPFSIW